jgi:uncharacterized membrane protein
MTLLTLESKDGCYSMKEWKYSLFNTRSLVKASLIGSLYCVIVLIFAPLSFGPVQIRIAESLTLLPYIWIEAVPGLFVGCVLANLIGGFGILDVVFGSIATLIAAILTRKMPNVFLAAVPPVLVNMIIVGAYLAYLLDLPLLSTSLYIGLGQALACFGLGIPMVWLVRKYW